ncbi:short-chain dehydrogenase, partial [Klebsiella pneumoniae]
MVDHSIKGKTVLITGGAKNLGGLVGRGPAAPGLLRIG